MDSLRLYEQNQENLT